MPELVQISVGYHPEEHGQLSYSRMSFTFTRAFPSYHFEWVGQLVSDASGKVVPLAGTDVLKVVFDQAQAHSADGTRSTIVSQPGRPIGYPSMTDYARAGDYEGVLTYGIGYTRAVLLSNLQTYVPRTRSNWSPRRPSTGTSWPSTSTPPSTTKVPDADRRRVQASAAR